MTLHAEVIVFCNDSIWLVGGKGVRRGLEGKHFSAVGCLQDLGAWDGQGHSGEQVASSGPGAG